MIQTASITPTGITFENEPRDGIAGCCLKRRRRVGFGDILSVEASDSEHSVLRYVDRSQKPYKLVEKVVKLTPGVEDSTSSTGNSLTGIESAEAVDVSLEERVMTHAYSGCLSPRTRLPLLVIVNPHSGPGRALDNYMRRAAPVFAAAGLRTEVAVTEYPGHATDIARRLPRELHDTIVCVSGDGLPHEVLNGLATRENDALEALQHFGLAQLPGGSGNAMCMSLNDGTIDWVAVALGIVKGLAEPADVMSVSQGNERFLSFLSQSYGIIADCDLGTEDMRWMGGARFTVGVLMKCFARNKYPCEIAYEVHNQVHNQTTSMSTSLNTPTLTPASASSSKSGPQTVPDTSLKSVPAAPATPVTLTGVHDPIPAHWVKERHPDLSMFYVGKMRWMASDALVFPRCEILDGAMDMIYWDNSFGSVKALSALTKFGKGTHVGSVPVYKKVRAYRLTPLVADQFLSIDGESYPCTPLQVEVLPGAARLVTPCV